MLRYNIIVVFLLISFCSVAQDGYPIKIQKGDSKNIKATEQALWILKESQFNNALKDSKEQKVSLEIIQSLEGKVVLLEKKQTEKDSLITLITKDRDYYKKTWESTNEDLTQLGKLTKAEIRKKKFYRITTIIGIPAAFILGVFVAL